MGHLLENDEFNLNSFSQRLHRCNKEIVMKKNFYIVTFILFISI